MVFGATEKWARAFAGLDGQLPHQTLVRGRRTVVFAVIVFSQAIERLLDDGRRHDLLDARVERGGTPASAVAAAVQRRRLRRWRRRQLVACTGQRRRPARTGGATKAFCGSALSGVGSDPATTRPNEVQDGHHDDDGDQDDQEVTSRFHGCHPSPPPATDSSAVGRVR